MLDQRFITKQTDFYVFELDPELLATLLQKRKTARPLEVCAGKENCGFLCSSTRGMVFPDR